VAGERVRSVAVLGTGIMGTPMARRIAGAGLEVRVWNRTRERAEALSGDIAKVAATPAEAVDGADVMLTMLTDADAVESAVTGDDGGLAGAGPGSIWMQASTVGIAGTERLAALAEERGVELVDSPVVGTRAPAEAGELVVLASGPDRARDRLEPVFEAIGSRTVWCGEAGAGTRMKLVVNAWLLTLTAGLAESITFAERIGIDPGTFLDVIKDGPVGPPYADLKGRAMVARDFGEVAFPLRLAEKDAALVIDALDDGDLALLAAAREAYGRALADAAQDEDMAAVLRAYVS
jgi:3-hydroxyisobutyrate dehydrogenase